MHNPGACRSYRFIYNGRIKQEYNGLKAPEFFCSTSTKRLALWSIFCSKKPECPSVPVPKQGMRSSHSSSPRWALPQDLGYSAERWNNAVAGLCLSCRRDNYAAEIHMAVTGGGEIQADMLICAIKQAACLTSKESPADELHLKAV